MVIVYSSTYIVWLWVRREKAPRSGWPSFFNSRVPTYGATSVPSVSAFFGNPILLQYPSTRLHRTFKVSIGLDETSCSSRWAYPYFHCFLYSSSATGLGSSRHPDFMLCICFFTISWRARGGSVLSMDSKPRNGGLNLPLVLYHASGNARFPKGVFGTVPAFSVPVWMSYRTYRSVRYRY